MGGNMYPAAERYLILLDKFGGSEEIGATTEVSLDELSLALFCTIRNVKIIIRKLVDEGLIEWQAGRGRGNRSHLNFLVERETLLQGWAQELARKGEYKQAFEFLKENDRNGNAKERFVQWLDGHFGYEYELTNSDSSGNTLRFPVYKAVDTLDPSEVYSAFDAHMIRQLFDRLVHYEASSGNIMPCLAHTWECNDDATEWTFYLRRGIRFHHGRELSSDDILFTFERLRDSKANSWMVRGLKHVECPGPRTVRILLDRPNWIFLRYLSSAAMSILPREVVEGNDSRFGKWLPIGSGPFRLIEWTEDRLELAANTDYYQGRAHLDRVILAFLPEEPASLSTGTPIQQLFIEHEPEPNDPPAPDADWKTIEALSNGCTLISWNLNIAGSQQSDEFRRAFDLLIDREEMIRDLAEDRMFPALGFRPAERTPYAKNKCNPEEARRLLRESGYDGSPIIMQTYGIHEADALWMKRKCAEFGIRLKVQVKSKDDIRKPEALASGHCILYNVVIAREEVCEIENYEQTGHFLKEYLHPEMIQWAGEQINLALASKSPEERRILFDGIESRLREEAHVTFLLHKKLHTHVHPTVRGVGLNSHGWMDFKDIWLERQA